MKYLNALETIEKWLEKHKIRDYCHSECGGECCIQYCKKRCQRPPLPCAIFLCQKMRDKLFGFHNGEKYHRKYLEIVKCVVYAGYPNPPEPTDVNINLEIPDELVNSIIDMQYEEDIHK